MPDKRIIDYNQADTLESDDYLIIDGSTNGTRKIDPNKLVKETDKTLSIENSPADAKAVGDQLNDVKADLKSYVNTTFQSLSDEKCTLELSPVIPNSYYDITGTPGALITYNGWDRTDLIPLPVGCNKLLFFGVRTLAKYNCFFKQDKSFDSSFQIWIGHDYTEVDVPSTAKYVAFSAERPFINMLAVKYTISNDNLGNYLQPKRTLKICSWNAGLWTDGKSDNARVADEDVPVKSVELRRFLGEMGSDIVMCEEAPQYFNKSSTVPAFSYCFKNNFPYGWLNPNGAGIAVNFSLLSSKYEMKNIVSHNYICESDRGYVTFDIDYLGKTITFVLCHLSTESNSTGIRQQEMAELSDLLKTLPYGILCGDFNAYSKDEYANHFADFNMANCGYFGDFVTWPKEGFESWNKCLDNIITTKNIRIINVKMGTVDMSDHNPLIAECEIS